MSIPSLFLIHCAWLFTSIFQALKTNWIIPVIVIFYLLLKKAIVFIKNISLLLHSLQFLMLHNMDMDLGLSRMFSVKEFVASKINNISRLRCSQSFRNHFETNSGTFCSVFGNIFKHSFLNCIISQLTWWRGDEGYLS